MSSSHLPRAGSSLVATTGCLLLLALTVSASSTREYKRASSYYYRIHSRGTTHNGAYGYISVNSEYYRYAANYTGFSYADYRRSRQLPADSSRAETQDSCPETRDRYPSSSSSVKVWVAGALKLSADLARYSPGSFEVDLYREMAWRSPCVRANDLLVTAVCTFPDTLDVDAAALKNAKYCRKTGSYSGRDYEATVQGTTITVVKVLLGVTTTRATALQSALFEAARDSQSEFARYYGITPVMTAIPDYEYPSTHPPSTGASAQEDSIHTPIGKYMLLLIPTFICLCCVYLFRYMQMKRRKVANAMNDVINNNRPTDHNGKSEDLSAPPDYPPAYPPPAYAPPAFSPGPSPLHSDFGAGAPAPTAPPAPPNFGHNPYRGAPSCKPCKLEV